MRRQSQEEVAAAARRRLDLLRRELEQAGLRAVEETERAPGSGSGRPAPTGAASLQVTTDEELPSAQAVTRAGRHARPGGPGRLRTWLEEQVPDALRGRVGLGGGPVLLVVLLVALACVVTGVAVMRMAGRGEQVVAPTGRAGPLVATAPGPSVPSGAATAGSPTSRSSSTGAAAGATTGTTTGGTAGKPAGNPAGTVTVDVAGKVVHPGVRVLPAGSRVVDALRRAGGARGGVDLTGLNLARVLVDGEQILVGRATAAVGGAAASASTAAPPVSGPLVNLNTATEEQLDTLPGVGPVTAQKILQWRSAHGAFSSVDELLEVDGIGEKTLADLAPMVTL